MATEKLKGLDGLRALLALTVFASHAWLVFVRPLNGIVTTPGNYWASISARLAVVCFFVLSGYVITLSIHANRRRHGAFAPDDYFLARLFRVAPPLLVTIAITWLVAQVLLVTGLMFVGLDSAARMAYVTLPELQLKALITLCIDGELMGGGLNGPLWSLVFEIQLYVIAGLVAAVLFARRPLARIAAGMLLAAYLPAIGLSPLDPPRFDHRVVMMAAFGLGAMAYIGRQASARVLAGIALALVPLALTAWAHRGNAHLVHSMSNSDALLWLQMVIAGWCALLIIAVARTGWLSRLHAAGAWSYTLYILHFPLLLLAYFLTYHLARPAVGSITAASITGTVGAAIVLAAIVFIGRAVERPQAQRAAVVAYLRRLFDRSPTVRIPGRTPAPVRRSGSR